MLSFYDIGMDRFLFIKVLPSVSYFNWLKGITYTEIFVDPSISQKIFEGGRTRTESIVGSLRLKAIVKLAINPLHPPPHPDRNEGSAKQLITSLPKLKLITESTVLKSDVD